MGGDGRDRRCRVLKLPKLGVDGSAARTEDACITPVTVGETEGVCAAARYGIKGIEARRRREATTVDSLDICCGEYGCSEGKTGVGSEEALCRPRQN